MYCPSGRLLQLGGEQHGLLHPNSFLVRWEGEGRRVPPSLVALWVIMLCRESFTWEIMLLRRCVALPLPEKPDAAGSLST